MKIASNVCFLRRIYLQARAVGEVLQQWRKQACLQRSIRQLSRQLLERQLHELCKQTLRVMEAHDIDFAALQT